MKKDYIPQFPTSQWKVTPRSYLDKPNREGVPYYDDPTGRAAGIIDFISEYVLWKGDKAGEYFVPLPFQKAIIHRIYGPSKADGSPLVRTAAIWIPRGNGKTPLGSALALAHLYGPMAVQGGEGVLAGADKQDAGTAFKHCQHMADQEGWGKDILAVRPSRLEMEYRPNKSELKAVSMEPYSKYSKNVNFFLADEIHSWPELYARPLFNAIRDSQRKQKSPLRIIISVAPEGQGGFAVDEWNYSLKVARGEINDPTYASIFFTAQTDDDWRDEKVWFAANPAMQHGLINLDEIRSSVNRAEAFPTEEAWFKRFTLNIPTQEVADPWVSMEVYDKQELRRQIDELRGKPCWVGVDLSSSYDLTAVVLIYPDGDTLNRSYDVYPMFFLPKENLGSKSDVDRADYVNWERLGHLTTTPGNVIDKRQVTKYIRNLTTEHDVKEVVFDPHRSVDITAELLEDGIECTKVGQGFLPMGDPMSELKRAILNGQWRHGNNPVLRYCFGNATTLSDNHENEKFTKKRSAGRIDGASASVTALARIMVADLTPPPQGGFDFLDVQFPNLSW